MKDIMETTKSQYRLLMAHPEANGFLGAKFPAGGIPHAYTSIAKMFFNQVRKLELQTFAKFHFVTMPRPSLLLVKIGYCLNS